MPGVDRGRRRFERGFLVEACLEAGNSELAAALGVREWATMEALTLRAPGDHRALLEKMPCLRSLSLSDDGAVKKLAMGPPLPGLRALGARAFVVPADSTAFPGLQVLAGLFGAYEGEQLHTLLARQAESGIPVLVLKGFRESHLVTILAEWLKVGPPEFRMATAYSDGFDAEGWRIRVRRGNPRAQLAWAGGDGWRKRALCECLEALTSSGFKEIENQRSLREGGEGRARGREAGAPVTRRSNQRGRGPHRPRRGTLRRDAPDQRAMRPARRPRPGA
ncbi:MAG: hypothetical protein QM765_28785 [Myxococcales bacterium]